MHRNAAALATLTDQLLGPRQRPAWFDPSITRILQHGQTVMTAAGPRELEQATAELAGAEVHRALREVGAGLWFDWWFQELARAAGERVTAEAAGNGDAWQAPWRLLHGLAAIGSPALRSPAQRSAALQAAGAAAGVLAPEQAAAQPDWLSLCPDGAVTGQVWVMHDDYRTRFAVLAECGYPGGGTGPHGADPHVFLSGIDACGFAILAGALHRGSNGQSTGNCMPGATARPGPRRRRSAPGTYAAMAASHPARRSAGWPETGCRGPCRGMGTPSHRTASSISLPAWTTTGCPGSRLRKPLTSCCLNGSGGMASRPEFPGLAPKILRLAGAVVTAPAAQEQPAEPTRVHQSHSSGLLTGMISDV